AVSLFERLADSSGPAVLRRLDTQYRMHSNIMEFSSLEFYEADLIAHSSVEAHLLCDLPGVERNDITTRALEFIATAGAGFDEEVEPDGQSRFNRGEAD